MAAVPRKNDINRTEEGYARLPRFDWDFSTCPNWELAECWYYEFKRESPPVRQIVVGWRKVWRKICDPPTFDFSLNLAQAMLMPPEPGHLYALCPEWPWDAYLSIPPAERKRRFSQLFSDETKSLAAELEPRPAHPGDLSLEAANFIRELLGDKEKIEENVTLWIPWWMVDKEIKRRFAAWLRVHRTYRASVNVSKRTLGADLKALGALRILRVENGDWRNGPEVYKEQAEWIKGRKRAEAVIERVNRICG
jgi:hypothetical protein